MGLILFFQILLFSILSSPPSSHGWGKEGHIMVCKIAQQYFTEKTAKTVIDLLPESAEGELSTVCPWADQVRFRYHWSSPLHYINTPGVCTYKYSRDCHNSKGEKDMCVVGAINNYTEQLRDYGDSSSGYNLTESLMFLAHFVGDVHQPLHVGYEADEGGNTIIVHWYRRKTNLHHVWDTNMIETAMKDFYNDDLNSMVEGIRMNITEDWSDEVDHWENCQNKRVTCANSYASESIHLACNYAYKDVEQNSTLGDDYFFSRLPVLEKRLAQAGVRLALILNRIFDPKSVWEYSSVIRSIDDKEFNRAANAGLARI
ncbi:putative bifunctional nuclease precursor [Iris pallida]|uniref:Aspergillus nuclease S1 n=1 Tax=Iris pallida TaxID=29817 RepID=A0AAX6FXU4_IRIPA|nr:putative bifunctional nuclease precursor [Iris pallida]